MTPNTFLKIRKQFYRIVLIDTITELPIAETIVEKEDNKTIYDFINKSTPPFKRKSIVTDSKIGYDTVVGDLGFTYPPTLCIPSFTKNQWLNKRTS